MPGISHPAKILASDGKEYFLKGHYAYFDHRWGRMEAALAQELFSYQLANYMDIPVTNVALIEIDESDLDVYSELTFIHHIAKKGLYLAIEAVETTDQNLKILLDSKNRNIPQAQKKINTFFRNVQNKIDIPKIIYFDLLTANIDRYNNAGNFIFKKTSNGNYIIAIDFGFCFFGPFWNSKVNNLLSKDFANKDPNRWKQIILKSCLCTHENYKRAPVLNLLNPYINFNVNPFAFIHSVALNLTSDKLANMLRAIPDEWLVQGDYQRNIYLNFILNQVKMMPTILEYAAMNKFFTNFTGGNLIWPQEKNTLIQ